MTITPKEYAFADGDLAEAMRLPQRDDGWGLLFCTDDHDLRYTYAGDAQYLRVLLDIPPDAEPGTTGGRDIATLFGGEGMELPPETFPLRRRGWPDQWNGKDYRRDDWQTLAQ